MSDNSTPSSSFQANKTPIITPSNFLQIANLNFTQCKTIISTNPQVLTYQHPNSGDSLLHLSVQKQNYPLTQFLLEKNIDCNSINSLSQTPLHIAVETKNHMIINSLLESNANANATNHKGDTPMHLAADNGEYKVIRLLLLYKADPMIQNAKGAFPVDNAIEKRHQKCIDVFAQTRSFSDKQLTYSTQNPNERNRLEVSNNIFEVKCVSVTNDIENQSSGSAKDNNVFLLNKRNDILNDYPNKYKEDDCGDYITGTDDKGAGIGIGINKGDSNGNNNESLMRKDNDSAIYKKKCITGVKMKGGNNGTNDKQLGDKTNSAYTFKKVEPMSINTNTNTTTPQSNSNSNSNSNREKHYDSFSLSISMTNPKFNEMPCVVVSLEDEPIDIFIDNDNEIYAFQSKANDINVNVNYNNNDQDNGIDHNDNDKVFTNTKRFSTPLSKHHTLTYSKSKSKEYNGYEDIDNFICNLGSPTQDMTQSPNQNCINEAQDENENENDNSNDNGNSNDNEEGIVVNDVEIFSKSSTNDFLEIIEPEITTNHQHQESLPSSAPISANPNNGLIDSNSNSNSNRQFLEWEIESFLKDINMEMYAHTFLKEGFDDMSLMINQMKSGFGISDSNLKEIGISKPGHRARILIRIQEMSNGFTFEMPDNAVYYLNPKPFKGVKYDFKVKALINWLKEIKMESFIEPIYDAGYHSIELLYIQMISKNPLTESILEHEVGIDKVGYRTRLLNKIYEASFVYISQLKSVKPGLITRKSINKRGCECAIY